MSSSERQPATGTQRWRVATACLALVTFTVIAGYYVPARREASRLRGEREALQAEQASALGSLAALRADLGRTQAQIERLRLELDTPKSQSAKVRERIEKLERRLSAQFGRLAQGKMMLVSSAGDRVSIALAVPALFATRDRLTPNGRSLLCELAKTIMAEFKGQIRVTGYYGKERSAGSSGLSGRHPTPWHLSAARAASAADALERSCGAPAERFFVVGYGPRPAGPLGENVALEFVFRPEDDVRAQD